MSDPTPPGEPEVEPEESQVEIVSDDDAGDLEGPQRSISVGDPFDPEPGRERLRSQLAWVLVAYLGFALVAPFVLIGLDVVSPDDGKELLTLALSTMGTLTGTVLGFYFGRLSR